MRWLVVRVAIAGCAALAGCASAGRGNSIVGGLDDAGLDNSRGDANDVPPLDASVIDAPADEVTMSQVDSTAITAGNSIACSDTTTNLTNENTYYRVFTLADFGVTSTLHVTHIDFGIENADGGPSATQQPAQVTLGTYGDDPTGDTLDPTLIRTFGPPLDIMIADGTGTRMTVPITADVAPDARLIVELDVPSGVAAGSVFFIGTNAAGERKPGYLSAADCSLTVPTTMASISTQIMHGETDIILSVTGLQSAPAGP